MINYYNNQFKLDLNELTYVIRHQYDGMPIRFFGNDDWSNCPEDLRNIPKERRPYFVFSLFITITADQGFYSYYNEHYDKVNRLLQYPKFGWHGLFSPHNISPWLLIEKPIELGMVDQSQLDELIPEAADLFVKEVVDFKQHFTEFEPTDFFDKLLNDQDFVSNQTEICDRMIIQIIEKTRNL